MCVFICLQSSIYLRSVKPLRDNDQRSGAVARVLSYRVAQRVFPLSRLTATRKSTPGSFCTHPVA